MSGTGGENPVLLSGIGNIMFSLFGQISDESTLG